MPERIRVASNLPHGVLLQVKQPNGELIQERVQGIAIPRDPDKMEEIMETKTIVSGFALTWVDKDLWEAWIAEYKDTDIVKRGCIFAMPKDADVRAKAREMKDLKTGLEPTPKPKEGDAVAPYTGAAK